MNDPTRPNVENAGDPGQTEQAKRQQRFRDKQYLIALEDVLRTRSGRLVIQEIFRLSEVHGYHGVGSAESLNHNEGKRYIGVRLWNDVAVLGKELLTSVLVEPIVLAKPATRPGEKETT